MIALAGTGWHWSIDTFFLFFEPAALRLSHVAYIRQKKYSPKSNTSILPVPVHTPAPLLQRGACLLNRPWHRRMRERADYLESRRSASEQASGSASDLSGGRASAGSYDMPVAEGRHQQQPPVPTALGDQKPSTGREGYVLGPRARRRARNGRRRPPGVGSGTETICSGPDSSQSSASALDTPSESDADRPETDTPSAATLDIVSN